MIKIGGARINERGKVSGGTAGDQTGKEVCIQNWYDGKWTDILRPTVPSIGKNIAAVMKAICENDNIGYDQPKRNTAYQAWLRCGTIKGIKKPCSTDCTASSTLSVIAGFKASNQPLNFEYGSNAPTSSNMVERFMKTGCFIHITDKKFTKSSDYLRAGDILIRKGHHAVIVLEDGPAIKTITEAPNKEPAKETKNPYKEPTVTIKIGCIGEGTKWVQWHLKRLGYKGKDKKLIKDDGNFGLNTDYALRAFQKDKGLEVDGKCGPATRKELKK